jgi:plasmid stabilization system protein ParE
VAQGYRLSPEAQQDIAGIRDFYVQEAGARVPAMQPLGIARVLHGSRDLTALFAAEPPRVD